ncbi:FKBP-type peptidyl-prolyl cis-trans isomerase [bacterium]|nr:MAG: FKBP-type peptidyl-prolyl cis-trans isomerase [bacterium]
MNTLLAVLLAVSAVSGFAAEGAPAALPAAAPDDRAKVLYALGAMLVGDYGLRFDDVQAVADGMSDAAAGKPLRADLKELRPKVAQLKNEAVESRRLALLDAYAAEPGAKRLPSGLIFKELKAGTGPKPAATSMVKVHYHGTFPDGNVFDSSVQRGEPMEFPLNGVIPCWTEGVQLIGVGGKAKLVCPYGIAYGERGRPPVIPERATLVFEVELLDVKK